MEPAGQGPVVPLRSPDGVSGIRLTPPLEGDRRWMARALERAQEAALHGEVPVGAVLVRNDRMLAEGFNQTRSHPDPTAHAEVEVLRAAARREGGWRLLDTTLYVTLEPCAQCAGALVLARVGRLVFGASDPKAGMVGSLGNLVQDPRLNHRIAVTSGVLESECAALLRSFFHQRRRRGT
jgi:tRNA(adenine34) deaminase